jgi:voltage-gated potassium channel
MPEKTRRATLAHHAFSLRGLRAALLIATAVAIGGGVAFSAAERHVSVWDGIYWSLVTMTTVGYGDIAPHTVLGRVIAFAVMFVGIGFVAALTAALAERFLAHGVLEQAEEELVEEIEVAEGELLKELKDVMDRLQQLEKMVRQLEKQRKLGPPRPA